MAAERPKQRKMPQISSGVSEDTQPRQIPSPKAPAPSIINAHMYECAAHHGIWTVAYGPVKTEGDEEKAKRVEYCEDDNRLLVMWVHHQSSRLHHEHVRMLHAHKYTHASRRASA